MARDLSKKDSERRDLILNGNMWHVVLYIATPLAVYQWMNQFFKLFDSMIASQISPMSVSAVAYLSQVSNLINAVATGLTVGACIKISEAYGSGEFELVHKRVNGMFKMCAILGLAVACTIPFSSTVLKLIGSPEDFIVEGSMYFAIILFDMIILIFNSAYIALERVRGNSTRILKLNVIALIIKLTLNCLFVFVFNFGVTIMAVATVISDMVVFSSFVRNLCLKNKGDIFSISGYNLRLDKEINKPLWDISFPVITEKFLFQLGKVIVSTMSASFGSLVTGALGVSNNIGAMTVTPQNGFKDAGSSIISQNIGAGKKKRSLEAFYILCIINFLIGVFGVLLALTCLPFLVSFFDGGDAEFSVLIQHIYVWEAWGAIPQGLFTSVLALLYGYGFTKLTLVLNVMRLFVFRIPMLWYLQNFTEVGYQSVGIVMTASNTSISVVSIIMAIIIIIRIRKEIEMEEEIQKNIS